MVLRNIEGNGELKRKERRAISCPRRQYNINLREECRET
jgi:hypothetical protein